MNKHKQCHMESDGWHYTAWLPASVAKIGNTVRIDDTFSGGTYKITWVSEHALASDYVLKHSSDYRNQRKASDI